MIVASSFQEVFQLVVDGDNDLFADLPQCCHHLSLPVDADAQQSLKHIWVRHEALAKQGIKFLAEGICRVCSPSLDMLKQLVDINAEIQVMDILSQQLPVRTSDAEVITGQGQSHGNPLDHIYCPHKYSGSFCSALPGTSPGSS